MCNIAPRGVYVCGNTSTSSGLTVTLSRDGTSGDFALEAGALVLGDQGNPCNATGSVEPSVRGRRVYATESQLSQSACLTVD